MIKKGSKEYKQIKQKILALSKELHNNCGYSSSQIMHWFNTSNLSFKGKKPIIMLMEGKEEELKKFIEGLKNVNK